MGQSRGMVTNGLEELFGGDGYVHHPHCSDVFMSVCIDQYVQFIVCDSYLNKCIKNRRRKEEKKEKLGQRDKRKRKTKGEKKEEGEKCEESIFSGLRVDLGWMVVSR